MWHESKLVQHLASIWRKLIPSMSVWRSYRGIRLYMDLRRHIHAFLLTRDHVDWEAMAPLRAFHGTVWDLGCSVGRYAVEAALAGNRVVAVDIDPAAIPSLLKTKTRAGLEGILPILGAVSDRTEAYSVDASRGYPRVRPGRDYQTTPFIELAAAYPPDFIKMDIEGEELRFFESAAFRDWIISNQIIWLVETHPWIQDRIPWDDWDSVPRVLFSRHTWLINGRETPLMQPVQADSREDPDPAGDREANHA